MTVRKGNNSDEGRKGLENHRGNGGTCLGCRIRKNGSRGGGIRGLRLHEF